MLWAFGLSLAGLALFVVSERRGANPILPLELLRARVFVAANVYTLLVYAALGGSSFYLALYLQSGAAGYSPSRASLVFVPISLVMFVLAARFGRLADRDGPRRYLTAAPLVMSVGYVLLMFVTSTNPLRPLPGVLVLALGLAMLVAPITATALKAAPDEFAGIAAGVNTTVSRLGGLIATPVLGVVITLVFAATATHHNVDPFAKHLTPDQRDATDHGLPGRHPGQHRALHRGLGGGLRVAPTSRRTAPLSGRSSRYVHVTACNDCAPDYAAVADAVFDPCPGAESAVLHKSWSRQP